MENIRAVVSMRGGFGSASPEGPSGEGGSAEWRRMYDRLEALVPRVEELAADRARLVEINTKQRELSEAREDALEARLLLAEASRRRWKAAYMEGASPKLAELQECDLVDSKTCDALFHIDNSQLQVQPKEATNSFETSENNADYEDIARYIRAELRKLKQAYETLTSNKNKEVSALRVVKDFLWNQLRTMDKDNAALIKIKEVEASQVNEVAQKLQQNVEELQMTAQRFRAEAVTVKKRVLILEGKLLEMHSLAKEKNEEIRILKTGQPLSLKCKCASYVSNETSQKCTEGTNEMDFEQSTLQHQRHVPFSFFGKEDQATRPPDL